MTESAIACGMLLLTPEGVTQYSGWPLLRIAYEADRVAAEEGTDVFDYAKLSIDLARKAAHDPAAYPDAMLFLAWKVEAPRCDICDQPLRYGEVTAECEHFLYRVVLLRTDAREALALLCDAHGCYELADRDNYCRQHRPDPARIIRLYAR